MDSLFKEIGLFNAATKYNEANRIIPIQDEKIRNYLFNSPYGDLRRRIHHFKMVDFVSVDIKKFPENEREEQLLVDERELAAVCKNIFLPVILAAGKPKSKFWADEVGISMLNSFRALFAIREFNLVIGSVYYRTLMAQFEGWFKERFDFFNELYGSYLGEHKDLI